MTKHEIQLSKEVLTLSKCNGLLIGSLEGVLNWDIPIELKLDIIDTVKEVKMITSNSSSTLNQLVNKITEIVFDYFEIPLEEAINRSRNALVAKARHFAVYFVREELKITYDEIGRRFNRDHASILHSCKTIKDLVEVDKEYQEDAKKLKLLITNIY